MCLFSPRSLPIFFLLIQVKQKWFLLIWFQRLVLGYWLVHTCIAHISTLTFWFQPARYTCLSFNSFSVQARKMGAAFLAPQIPINHMRDEINYKNACCWVYTYTYVFIYIYKKRDRHILCVLSSRWMHGDKMTFILINTVFTKVNFCQDAHRV